MVGLSIAILSRRKSSALNEWMWRWVYNLFTFFLHKFTYIETYIYSVGIWMEEFFSLLHSHRQSFFACADKQINLLYMRIMFLKARFTNSLYPHQCANSFQTTLQLTKFLKIKQIFQSDFFACLVVAQEIKKIRK